MTLEAIKYSRGQLQILDQLRLPYALDYNHIRSSKDGWHAIKEMRTRGAPAIAIVAALSLAIELENAKLSEVPEELHAFIVEKLDYLVTSRPTAVNLADAADKLKKAVSLAAKREGVDSAAVKKAYIAAAERMLIEDVKDNKAIGRHGSQWIKQNTHQGRSGNVSVLTHCNTGSLATAGYGTALGVIRSLHERGELKRAFCTETRPYYQGSRLTAFELVHDNIPSTLITDSMAASLLQLKGRTESIAAIVVGADRVAANGDTANKIGTYQLALIARSHGVKFLVAAPRTTIDMSTKSGTDIVIEERPGKELTLVKGPRYDGVSIDRSVVETVCIAAEGIDVWNPAFDVTPAKLIDAIITEVGVVEKGGADSFDLSKLFEDGDLDDKPTKIGGM